MLLFHLSFYFCADHTDGTTENNRVLPEEASTARRTTRTSSHSKSSLKSSQCEPPTGELSKRSSRFTTVDPLRNNGITGSDQTVANVDNQRIVSKQTLSSTKLPIDQFVAAALANGSVTDETTIKDFSMLQSTLFTLQNQQIFQLKLIERLKSQLLTSSSKNAATIEDALKKSGDDLKLAAHDNENPKSKVNNRGAKERKLR